MASEIDEYLAGLDEPKRAALQTVRERIRAVLPNAQEGISYAMPAFTVEGKTVAGFSHTGGSLHFSADGPLDEGIIAALIDARLAELGLTR